MAEDRSDAGFAGARPADTPAPLVSEHWVRHPEGRLFARQWMPAGAPDRSGAAIVLLHDSLGCVALWRDFPEALCLATGRRVVAYDRLGFGRSDVRIGRPPLDFVAQEAGSYFPALRSQLGLDRFALLGHSVGGGMAIEIAARDPGRCEALVTVAAQVFAEDRTLAGIRAARDQFADPLQIERLVRYHGERARWVVDAWVEGWLDPAFAAWSLAAVLPRVACPVLAIHGERDEYGSAIHPRRIGELSGGPSRVVLMPDTGHVPHREQPGRVCALVAEFLAQAVLPPGSGPRRDR